jgi:hypothetical protein
MEGRAKEELLDSKRQVEWSLQPEGWRAMKARDRGALTSSWAACHIR